MTPTDLAIEHRLGRVLTAGGIISTALLTAGLAAFFVAPARGVSSTLLNAGLVLLMATPVARVIVATFAYLMHRDWLYATLAVLVLCVLLAGVIVAIT